MSQAYGVKWNTSQPGEAVPPPSQIGNAPPLPPPALPGIASPVPTEPPNRRSSQEIMGPPPVQAPSLQSQPVTQPVTQPTIPIVLPAVPAPPVKAPEKCITEGCNCKPKDRGMCVRCLTDTKAYIARDPNITWEFLEANGLALPASSVNSGNKFLAGLTAKLTALHQTAGRTVRSNPAS